MGVSLRLNRQRSVKPWEASVIGQLSKLPSCQQFANAALAAVIAFGSTGAAYADAIHASRDTLTSHRALYVMDLGRASQGANISSASGTMFYRFEALCEGWEVESRVSMQLGYNADGETRMIETTWSFSSFESYDGEQFTFDVDHSQDGVLQEIFAGEAGMADGVGSAQFDNEENFSVDLPNGTLFPAKHLLQLLAEAKLGKDHFPRTIFDGASLNNPYLVNGYILGSVVDGEVIPRDIAETVGSRHVPALKAKATSLPAALTSNHNKLPVWRVRLAYFPLISDDELPEFEIEVDYSEDGVAQRMVQDFGDFTLNLTPSRFELLPKPVCQ